MSPAVKTTLLKQKSANRIKNDEKVLFNIEHLTFLSLSNSY
jgi:hypothetical protein